MENEEIESGLEILKELFKDGTAEIRYALTAHLLSKIWITIKESKKEPMTTAMKTKVSQTVTPFKMHNILEQFTKSKPISIVYLGTVDTYKAGNDYYGRVTKITKISGRILKDLVEVHQAAGDFSPIMSRKWGKRVGSTCIIKHKDSTYIEVFPKTFSRPRYFVDGVECKDRKILNIISKHLKPSSAPDVITVSLDNIKTVVIGGTTYHVSNVKN